MPPILVLDFEGHPDVSGKLFPVEIGVAGLDGRTAGGWIHPRPEWVPGRPTWHLHAGLLEGAMRKGKDAAAVAGWFRRIAFGKRILSDCPAVDVPLLSRLMDGEPAIPIEDFFSVVDVEAKKRSLSISTINGWIVEIDETRGPAHRAGPDAACRAELLRRIMAN